MPAFTHQIDYRPVFLSLLQMREVQIGQFQSAQAAAKQHGENRAIPFALRVLASGACQNRRASSAVSPFPSLTPNFFTPFDALDACSELRTEETSIGCFIGEPVVQRRVGR